LLHQLPARILLKVLKAFFFRYVILASIYCLIRIEWSNCDVVHLGPVVDGKEVISSVVDGHSTKDDTVVQLETVGVADVIGVQPPQMHEAVFGRR